MEFKDKLKALRKEKGISQQTLADAIFVSRSAVAKWENGLGYPNEDSLAALQEYFCVEPEHFYTREPEQVIVVKNRQIHAQRLGTILVLALMVVIAGWLFLNTKAGMKLTVAVCRPILDCHAQAQLSETSPAPESIPGYTVRTYPEVNAVFYDSTWSWGYRGYFYSAEGGPVGYQGTEMVFYRCGNGQWYWGEQEGDNWMHAEHIAGNWYWYEMHF